MRACVLLLLLLSVAPSTWAVTNTTDDCTTIPQDFAQIALTSTEQTVTLTNNMSPLMKGRIVQMTCSTDWGWSYSTGALASKTLVPANTPYTFAMGESSRVYWVATQASNGNFKVVVLAAYALP